MRQKVRCKGLSRQYITTMTLICQNTCKCTGIPLHTPQLRLTAILHQKGCNLRKRISIQVQVVNHLYRLRFLRVNYKVAFLVFIVSKQCRGQEQATAEPPINRPVHNDRFGMRFFLCHRCQNRQNHASIAVQRIDIIRFKFHTHRRIQIFQKFNHRKAINDISSETGNGFCKNEVNLACLAVLNQLLHPFSVFQRCAANALIRIDSNKYPSRLCLNIIRIIVFLKFIRRSLFIIISGNTDICCHTPNHRTCFQILYDFGGNDLQFRYIYTLIAVSDFLLTVYCFYFTGNHVLFLILPYGCSNTTVASSDNFGYRVLSSYFLRFCG